MKIKHPIEVEAAITACKEAGNYEQAGYLMAPGLQVHTGDTPEEMLQVCALLDQIEGRYSDFYQCNEGVKRWVNEQIAKGKH